MAGWCHGAPGIALGRLGMLGSIDDAEIREEIARALETTRSARIDQSDHICCGSMSRVAILTLASHRLGDEGLLAAAERLAERALERGRRPADSVFDPTLFLGAAGIAWTLLGLSDPACTPCVLTLE
jgi:lantibiotic modifying enzyme